MTTHPVTADRVRFIDRTRISAADLLTASNAADVSRWAGMRALHRTWGLAVPPTVTVGRNVVRVGQFLAYDALGRELHNGGTIEVGAAPAGASMLLIARSAGSGAVPCACLRIVDEAQVTPGLDVVIARIDPSGAVDDSVAPRTRPHLPPSLDVVTFEGGFTAHAGGVWTHAHEKGKTWPRGLVPAHAVVTPVDGSIRTLNPIGLHGDDESPEVTVTAEFASEKQLGPSVTARVVLIAIRAPRTTDALPAR